MAEPRGAPAAASEGRGCALGCLAFVLLWSGFFGGGIIAVFVAKVVGSMRGCQPAEGLPACDWHVYGVVGGVIGAIVLPTLVWWRLRRHEQRVELSERG